MGRQLVCTIFCVCDGDSDCCNPFNIKQHANDVNDDDEIINSGVEDSQDAHDKIY